jgi:hypothetical protein
VGSLAGPKRVGFGSVAAPKVDGSESGS